MPISESNESKPIVVYGATGRVGSLVVSSLRARGRAVLAVGRPSGRLSRLSERGVTVHAGSHADPGFFERAFAVAEAAYLMTPVDTTAADVNGTQFSIIDSMVRALATSPIRHVVLLSSWGAELPQRVGGIVACHRFEQALKAIPGLNVVNLRPVWFMDNFLWSIPLIRMAGINGSAFDGNVAFPMIAARDIAPFAVQHLLERTFSGNTIQYLNGARDQSLIEVTSALGRAIGKEALQYVRMPEDVYRRGLTGAGLTPDAAELAIEIGSGIASGLVHAEPRAPHNTTPTTIEQFAQEIFAPRYRDSPPAALGARLNGLFLRAYLALRGARAARAIHGAAV